MKRTMGEVLGLRMNNYYVTCKTPEEYQMVMDGLEKAKALRMDDFTERECTDGILIISKVKIPGFRGQAYKEWRRITGDVYISRR